MIGVRKVRPAVLALVILAVALLLPATPAGAAIFSNTAPITTPDPPCLTGPAQSNIYPSNITVSGLTGLVSDVNVALHGVNHPFEGDLELLLVGPGGAARSLVLLSDAGTGMLTNATLTFDDAAAAQVPQNTQWGTGAGSATSTKPTDYQELMGTDAYPFAPAPVNHPGLTGSSTLASIYNGTNPNGTWSVYVLDDACSAPDPPSTIGTGWSLNITTVSAASTTTTVSSAPNPSTTGASVVTTATVTSSGSAVTTGSVTFTEGATTLAANVALSASGQASFSRTNFPEGNHVITATYNGTGSFATSNGSTNLRVDNATTTTGSTYCNTGPVTIPGFGAATPYPSHILVGGVPGPAGKVTVQLKNVTHAFAEDIDVLLAGPSGANNLVLVSDAGNASAVTSNVSVTFDDAAAGSLAATGAWAGTNASVTSRPVNHLGGVAEIDAFPGPAPATSAFTTLAAAFANKSANGTWKLYVVDDGAPDGGSIAGGWCVTITAADTTAPVTTITRAPASPTGSYTSDVHVTTAATDVGSGVAETRCVLDPPSVPASFDALPAGCPYAGAGAAVTSDGAHVVYAASRDVSSNKEVPVSSSFTIDKTTPAGGGTPSGGDPPPGAGAGTPPPAGTTSQGGGTAPPPAGTAPVIVPSPKPAVAPFSIAKLKAAANGTVAITLVVPGPGRLALKLTRKLGGKRARTYATARRAVRAAGRTLIRVKPSRKVLRSITAGKRTKITVKAVYTAAGGAASTKSAVVTVKLAKRKPG